MTHSKPGLGGPGSLLGSGRRQEFSRALRQGTIFGGSQLEFEEVRELSLPFQGVPPLQVEPELLQFCFLGWSLEGGGL